MVRAPLGVQGRDTTASWDSFVLSPDVTRLALRWPGCLRWWPGLIRATPSFMFTGHRHGHSHFVTYLMTNDTVQPQPTIHAVNNGTRSDKYG